MLDDAGVHPNTGTDLATSDTHYLRLLEDAGITRQTGAD